VIAATPARVLRQIVFKNLINDCDGINDQTFCQIELVF
jgi:hypothetical protein